MLTSKRALNALYGGRCAYCGRKITFSETEITHVLPLRYGGTDTSDNALPACKSCKERKGENTLLRFRNELEHKYNKQIKFYFERKMLF